MIHKVSFRQRLLRFAAEQRASATPAEKLLLARLSVRSSQVNWHWRFQHAIGSYIVDFFEPEAKIVIELDGGHLQSDTDHLINDCYRDAALASLGIRVLGFRNDDLVHDIEAVMSTIFEEYAKDPPLPTTRPKPQPKIRRNRTPGAKPILDMKDLPLLRRIIANDSPLSRRRDCSK
jgi:very-short-patch-repair endonuclease